MLQYWHSLMIEDKVLLLHQERTIVEERIMEETIVDLAQERVKK
jgi:hypothetical protein